MALAGVALFALTADFVNLRLQAERAVGTPEGRGLVSEALVEVATATNRYVDFAGRFSLPHPPSWAVYPYRAEGDYDVTLRGPHRMEICISSHPLREPSLAAVRSEVIRREQRLHMRHHLEEVEFHGRPAIRRVVPLRTMTVEMYDFVSGRLHMQVAVSAPPSSFQDLRPVLLEMLNRMELPSPSP